MKFKEWLQEKDQTQEGWLRNAGVAASLAAAGLGYGLSGGDNSPTSSPVKTQSQQVQDTIVSQGKSAGIGSWTLKKNNRGYAFVTDREVPPTHYNTLKMKASDAYMKATGSNMQGVQSGIKTVNGQTGVWFAQ